MIAYIFGQKLYPAKMNFTVNLLSDINFKEESGRIKESKKTTFHITNK